MPGAMERLDHVAKLVERPERVLARAVGRVRREEGDRRVAPVVRLAGRAILGVELKDGQQLDGGDAEFLQIGNLLDQAGIGAALRLGHAGAGMAGETAHVHLVNDRPRGRPAQRRVAFPVVGARIRHHALHRRGGVVAGLGGGFTTVLRRHHHAAAIRIQQHLGRIEPHPARRIGRPMHTIAIELARLHSRHERVPVVIGSVCAWIQFDGPAGSGIVGPIKEQQLHARGRAGEQAEVRAAAAEGGAERMAAACL